MAETVFGPSLNLIWSIMESMDINPEVFIEQSLGRKIDPKTRLDQNSRILYRDIEKIWLHLVEVSGDECLALKFADKWHPSHLGALGYAWLASSSLRTAFSRLQRYVRMVSEGVEITSSESGDEFSVVVSHLAVEQALAPRTDGTMAIILDMCRANLSRDFSPLRITFTRPAPKCAGEYYGYFRCPIDFDADDNRLVFLTGMIDAPSPGSNPKMAEISDRIIIDYLARMDKSDIISRVKSEIIRQMPSGRVTDHVVAEALHLSERSLQRALQEKGQSFKQLLTEIRHDLALKYVRDNSLSLTEISFMLGFSEMSAFSRAFKRWTGNTPSQLRI
jgi:AraC-like DNA-binding protein